MAAYTTTLTEKMRAALRISSTSEKITEEINDCIAACKADLKNDGVKVIKETDELIIRAITLYCKAEFGFNNNAEQFRKSYDALKMRLALSVEYNTAPEVSETAAENRVNKNGFAVKPEESARTVFCNKKTVGYSEYFKSQQTGKLVEAKYEVHKADYGGEDVVEVNGRRYFVLKTYDIGTDTIELTLTDLRHRNEV